MVQKKPLSIYIHIPFCVKKCLYCDFASAPGDAEQMGAYVRRLIKEIRSFEAIGSLYRVDTVFFGGGTPSLLPTFYVGQILNQLKKQYEFDPEAEISLEANPGTLNEEKLGAYRGFGINRLSLGLQSIHESELALLGRIHNYKDFLESYELARQAGFRNINVDLMSGLPKQTMDRWVKSLETVAALGPEHISAYSLSLEAGTPFHQKYSEGLGRLDMPGEELDRAMFHETKKILESRGYSRYEFSNYAKKGFECRHNMCYWTLGEYLGFGQAAASYLEGKRFVNPADPGAYQAASEKAYASFRSAPKQSQKEAMEEYMFLGLRTRQGISREDFSRRFGTGFPKQYEKELLDLYRQDLVEQSGGRIRLTDQGIDVSNIILARFLLD